MENAAKIQYFLKIKGKKQSDVARKAGVSEALVSMVINGTRRSRRIENTLVKMVGIKRQVLFPEVAA